MVTATHSESVQNVAATHNEIPVVNTRLRLMKMAVSGARTLAQLI